MNSYSGRDGGCLGKLFHDDWKNFFHPRKLDRKSPMVFDYFGSRSGLGPAFAIQVSPPLPDQELVAAKPGKTLGQSRSAEPLGEFRYVSRTDFDTPYSHPKLV